MLFEGFLEVIKNGSTVTPACNKSYTKHAPSANDRLVMGIVIVPGNPRVFWDQPVPDPSKTRTLVKGTGFLGFGYGFARVARVCKPARVRVTGTRETATDYGYLKTSATALGWYPNHWEARPPHR